MPIEFCIDLEQLEQAVKVLQAAHRGKFTSSMAIFRLAQIGSSVSDCHAVFGDALILRSHPHDLSQDWGRVTDDPSTLQLKDGECVPKP